jgi:hypothetical protein
MSGGGHGVSVEEFSKMLERGVFNNGDIITIVSKNNTPVTVWCYRKNSSGHMRFYNLYIKVDFKWTGMIVNNNQLVRVHLDPGRKDFSSYNSNKEEFIHHLTQDVKNRKVFNSYDTTERGIQPTISKFFHASLTHKVYSEHYYYDATNLIVLGAHKQYDDFAMISHNATRKVNAERNPTLSRVFSEHGMVNAIASFLPHKSGTVIDHERARQKQLERWSKQRQETNKQRQETNKRLNERLKYLDTMIDSVSNDLHRITLSKSKKEEGSNMKKNRTRRSRSI